VLIDHFYSGLNKDTAAYLDMTAGGSFYHKTLAEGMEILEIITENTSFAAESVPFHEQHKSCHEDILGAKSDHSLSIPLDSALEPSPEPRVLEKEEIRTPELHFKFEDDLSENFENTSNYVCKRRPSVPVASTYPIEAAFCRQNVKKSTTIMSSKRLREMELSSEVLRISSPPSTLPCTIKGTQVDTLYSPSVGANIISSECTFRHLRNEPLVETDKTFKKSWKHMGLCRMCLLDTRTSK